MGRSISVLWDIYVCKMEENIVAPSKPFFYKCYVDDTYVRKKNKETDQLYNALNSLPKYKTNLRNGSSQVPRNRLLEVTAKSQLKCSCTLALFRNGIT